MKPALITLIGVITGSAAGWWYWKNFGCNGSCLITSKPLNSSLYGGLLVGLFFYTIALFFSKKHK
ncbi:MAG: hypothetical protein ACHQF0_16665 [Chitinophagales bacterium]